MTWADAGFPGDVTLRPEGKVLYALFLGLQELASAAGYDLTKWTSGSNSHFLHLVNQANYAGSSWLPSFSGADLLTRYVMYFDAIFIPMLYNSFKVKYCVENLIRNCTNTQILSSINAFLGDHLINDHTHLQDGFYRPYGPMLTRKNGYFARWANQRYNLIRNMPIYTWVFNSDYVGFDQKSILYAVDIKDGLLGENFMNKNDFFRIRQKFSSTTVDPGFQIGYYAYVNGSYINTQYLENVQVNQLSPVDFDFSVVMLHKAVLNDSFGTGLSDGQIWSESISGFGTRTYSYTLPVSQDFKYIQQDSYVNIRILPQNNPWITGGI